MGIEIPEKYGGSGCNFMTTILTVEEVAKVDGAVSALVDIHNTLVNSLIKKVATEEQKAKYLPRLAQDYVSDKIYNTQQEILQVLLFFISNRIILFSFPNRFDHQ